MQPKEGDLRVWHVPQMPCNAFYVPVLTPKDAKKVMSILAFYDQFQLKNNIKPDYANASGLEVFRNGEWEQWESEDGDDIDTRELEIEGSEEIDAMEDGIIEYNKGNLLLPSD